MQGGRINRRTQQLLASSLTWQVQQQLSMAEGTSKEMRRQKQVTPIQRGKEATKIN